MALTNIPEGFKRDIDAQDTNIIPLVEIGNPSYIYISTNAYQQGDIFFKPLLLNIQSLQESLNIESRKYNIGSCNFNISNFEYEGERFSDLTNNYLLNQEIKIYWTSQSNEPFLIYKGVIRKYSYLNSQSITIISEDLSEKELHKDLCTDTLENNINKFYPLVFGSVDRSPAPSQTDNSNIMTIHADREDVGSSINAIFNQNTNDISVPENTANSIGVQQNYGPLYLYEKDRYVTVPAIHSDILNYGFQSERQYNGRADEAHIEMESPIVFDVTDNERFFPQSTLSINSLLIYDYTQFTSSENPTDSILGNENPNNLALLEFQGLLEDFYEITYNQPYKRYYSFPVAIIDTPDPIDGEFSPFDVIQISFEASFGWHFISISSGFQATQYLGIGAGKSLIDQRGITQGEFYPTATAGGDYFLTSNNTTSYSLSSASDSFSGVSRAFADNMLIAVEETSGTGSSIAYFRQSHTNFIRRYITCLIKEIDDKDFYLNVNGREHATPYLPEILQNIANNELDQNLNLSSNEFMDWKYAFTIDSKINSKNVIEQLASVSHYIPRFDSLGNFKLNTIPKNFIQDADHTIYEKDVIEYSFSRTSENKVYSKVEFNYNFNYATNEFDNKYTLTFKNLFNITDDISEYFDYYGLNYNHSESTLIIDDEKGKYIRDIDTAKKYTSMILSWFGNQHLIIKIKIPVSIGLPIEVGDLVDFATLIQEIKPYGIDYTKDIDSFNLQDCYKNFIVVKTNKNIDNISIELVQLHQILDISSNTINTCSNPNAENFNSMCNEENIQCLDDGSCIFPEDESIIDDGFTQDFVNFDQFYYNDNQYLLNDINNLPSQNISPLDLVISSEVAIPFEDIYAYKINLSEAIFFHQEGMQFSSCTLKIFVDSSVEDLIVPVNDQIQISLTDTVEQGSTYLRLINVLDDAEIFWFNNQTSIFDINNTQLSFSFDVTFSFTLTDINGNEYSNMGFVVPFQYTACNRGDANADGGLNALDVVLLINCVLDQNCGEIAPCAADVNGDAFIDEQGVQQGYNVLDIITLVDCVMSNTLPGSCGADAEEGG